jgi:hypothetical protein
MVNLATNAEIAPIAARRGSRDCSDRSDRNGNLDERVTMLVLNNDALDVAFVD